MAPRGRLVSDHLPAGLWASWGSPYSPGSPPLRDSEDSPCHPPVASVSVCEIRGPRWSPGPYQPGATREGPGVWARGGEGLFPGSSLTALPPPSLEGSLGRRPLRVASHTPPPAARDIHPAQKARAQRQTHSHGRWLCVWSLGPRGHLGSAAARLPRLPLKAGEPRRLPATLPRPGLLVPTDPGVPRRPPP